MIFYRLLKDTPVMAQDAVFRVVDTKYIDGLIAFHIVKWSLTAFAPKALAKVSQGVLEDTSLTRKLEWKEVLRWMIGR